MNFLNKTIFFIGLGVFTFIFYRQIFINISGLDRHFVSALHIALLSFIGFSGLILAGVKKRIPTTHYLYIALSVTIVIFTIIINIHGLSYAQMAVGIFCYIFGALYLYIYPSFQNFIDKYFDALVYAFLLLYGLSVVISLSQFMKIEPFFIFRTDESVKIKDTFFGLTRVNGLYGNFVDYAYLSYIVFVFSCVKLRFEKSILFSLLLCLSLLSIILTSTRAYIFLSIFSGLFFLSERINYRSILPILFLTCLFLSISIVVVNFYYSDLINPIFQTLLSSDQHTKNSNQVRIDQFTNSVSWAVEYFWNGLGPGFLLGPNEYKKDYVTDGILFMFLMELGTIVLIFLLIMPAIYIVKVFWSSILLYRKSPLAQMTFHLIGANFACLVINSALALPTSLALTLAIIGAFNYETRVRKKYDIHFYS